MKGTVYTYDIAIAAVMITLIAIIVYSNINNNSYSYDLLVMQQLAEDAARAYAIRKDCGTIENVISGQYSYEVYMNGQRECSRGSLGDVTVSAFLPVAHERNQIISDRPMYYYKSCNNRDRDGKEVYRCTIQSFNNIDDILNRYSDYINYGYIRVIVSR